MSNSSIGRFDEMGELLNHTVKIATTDTSTSLLDLIDAALGVAVERSKIRAILITCETNDARIAIGVAAALGATPVGHQIAVGQNYRNTSYSQILAAQVISLTSGSPATLHCTLEA